ncbi:hypothetical protein H8E77_22000 [bacterium]|nr:hypothetical protein [bacterium]
MPLVLSIRNSHPPKYISLAEAMSFIDNQPQLQLRDSTPRLLADSPAFRRPGRQNPSIVTRLRTGIDDGADISTVELDN